MRLAVFLVACAAPAHPTAIASPGLPGRAANPQGLWRTIANRAVPLAKPPGACVQGKQQAGPASVQGDLDRNLIRHTIHAHTAELSACYSTYLEHGALAGRLTARFTVAAGGGVADALVTGFDDALDTCVCDVLAQLTFVPGPAPFTVVYPIVFGSPLP